MLVRVIALSLSIAACSGRDVIGGAGETTTADPGDASTLSTTPPTRPRGDEPAVDPPLRPFVDQAKADLAARLGGDPESVSLVSAALVEWPDASLGCPKPGMAYAQVPTDGSLIVLLHGGSEYRYHTGGNVYVPFLCE
jgi:hypothetical protein